MVQKGGQVVCEDPIVYIQFRGPQSHIICEQQEWHDSAHFPAKMPDLRFQ
jgi:hypothetical protein